MGSKICMNGNCQGTTSSEWKKGWGLKSGGFATLCYSCGSAYENLFFCETFHLEEDGWRKCKLCGKCIHCGCIASKYLHDYLDSGGVGCISCTTGFESRPLRPIEIPSNDIPNGFDTLTTLANLQPSMVNNKMDCSSFDMGKLIQLSNSMEANQPSNFLHSHKGDPNSSNGLINPEEKMLSSGEVGSGFPNLTQQSVAKSVFAKLDDSRPTVGVKAMFESLVQPSLNFPLSTSLGTPIPIPPFPGGLVEGKEQNKVPSFQQGQRTRHVSPKLPKTVLNIRSEPSKGMVSQTRVARPPAEGRGRNQLLPRYWPRITDQELQKLSGDLNSTIVPLFEKVLSASDAGRIGRLVLPKACAEAYFPPISQSEGVPIRIQDIKLKEWTFQFRFWPNNNSRMYVLEGVTPCIQNMQLEAGDTVTFSRIDPGGKLVMGFRKATNVDTQDAQTSFLPNGGPTGESSFPGVNENLPTHGSRTNEDLLERSMLILEKKRSRNIGSKSKRLHMHSEDALELRVTWEEAQDLLRPPPSVKPSIVMVENCEFEEYDEPPVFGKRTIFLARASGGQEQWAQCDSCSKWRRLPVDILLPPKWTCSENIWDSNRCSCSAPDEMNPKEVERFFRVRKDVKKRRTVENKVAEEHEPSGLDALANAAVLGDSSGDPVGATTRHPRHRPGCTCIVCIQPPSGKGKHKPTCICNVCMTVKRRFKTLMLRKKKRQSECQAEIARKKDMVPPKDHELEMDGILEHALLHMKNSENGTGPSEVEMEVAETSKGQLDLNFHPNHREEDMLAEASGLSMTGFANAASHRLDMFLKHNGIAIFGPCLLSRAGGAGEGQLPSDDGRFTSVEGDVQNKGDLRPTKL